MDLLSHILSSLKIESTSISSWHLSDPWGVNVRNYDPGYCLIVAEGSCWVETDDDNVQLFTGDSIMAPRGGSCKITSTPGAATTDLKDLPWSDTRSRILDSKNHPDSAISVNHGGGGATCRLLGLAFVFESMSGEFVMSSLPTFIRLRGIDASTLPSIKPLIESLIHDDKPGYFAVAAQMAELVIMGLLRYYVLSSKNHSPGWLLGMQDQAIQKALLAIHAEPDQQWTVPKLASLCHLSRSAFASRFAKQVGKTPIDYLNNWRITISTQKLRTGNCSISQVAVSTGYQSDRVFRQAFKQRMGLSPQQYRKQFSDQ